MGNVGRSRGLGVRPNAPSIMTGDKCGEMVLADWLEATVAEAEEKASARL
eukprot:COSAG04_NODE_132_length_24268_cov_7.633426_16_plen_50_part_00